MKKILLFLLILSVATIVISCKKTENISPSELINTDNQSELEEAYPTFEEVRFLVSEDPRETAGQNEMVGKFGVTNNSDFIIESVTYTFKTIDGGSFIMKSIERILPSGNIDNQPFTVPLDIVYHDPNAVFFECEYLDSENVSRVVKYNIETGSYERTK